MSCDHDAWYDPNAPAAEPVGMQPDAEEVHAVHRPDRDDVPAEHEHGQPAIFHHSVPPRMEHQCVPEHDDERAVFFRVPAPETAPRIVAPQAAEHGADKAKEDREADSAVNHLGEDLAQGEPAAWFVTEDGRENAEYDID